MLSETPKTAAPPPNQTASTLGGPVCRPRISPVAAWTVYCAFCVCTGWILSALHALNRTGYVIAFAVGLAAAIVWQRKTGARIFPLWLGRRRRFRRPFPLAYLILALLAMLGAVLYTPTNYDALAYRVPRVFHWLAEEQWHWIHTVFPRLNTRACGFEWLSAPLLALFKTDRLLFLINSVSFLLFPGLVFSVFTRLGVNRRVAWNWMWIVPTGYCFVLQAGSISNDLFGAVFVLAAVDFALRARESRSARDFLLSILAAAMFTNSKLSNVPLLLPWAVCLLPSLPLIRRWPLKLVAVCVVAGMVSIVPISVLNWRYSSDWSGLKSEGMGMKKDLPVQFGANVVLIANGNLVPPVFPMASQWNQLTERAIPPALAARLVQTMEPTSTLLAVQGEMQIEENSGLGFGVSTLLLVSVLASVWVRRKHAALRSSRSGGFWQVCARWSPTIPLLVLMLNSNLAGPARLLTPYYALLMPMFLAAAGHERLVVRRWWRALVGLVFIMAAGLVIVSPARPLGPVQTVLKAMQARYGGSRLVTRASDVYSVYRNRNNAFAPVLAVLPPDLKVLGLVTYDDPEAALWQPLGSRRIKHVCPGDTRDDLDQRGIEHVLVNASVMKERFKLTPEEWSAKMNAQGIQKIPLRLRVAESSREWYLIRLQ